MSGPCAIAFDDNGNQVSCSDPSATSCTDASGNYVNCPNGNPAGQVVSTELQGGSDVLAPSVGLAAAGDHSGALSLTAPSSGSGNAGGIATAAASLFANITSVITGKPTTPTATVGASGLSTNNNSLFGNPIMLILLAVLAFFAFGALKHSR